MNVRVLLYGMLVLSVVLPRRSVGIQWPWETGDDEDGGDGEEEDDDEDGVRGVGETGDAAEGGGQGTGDRHVDELGSGEIILIDGDTPSPPSFTTSTPTTSTTAADATSAPSGTRRPPEMTSPARNAGTPTKPRSRQASPNPRHYQGALHRDAEELRRHLEYCPHCLRHQNPALTCPLHRTAVEIEAWATALGTALSEGCPMGPQDREKCCLNGNVAVQDTLHNIMHRLRDIYFVLQRSCDQCPKDGGWSEWNEWETCSVTCGSGTRVRMRNCSNPAPSNGGRNCEGPSRQTTRCYPQPPPVNGVWSHWGAYSACSVTCGEGTRQRIRTCNSPPPNACGQHCVGKGLQTDRCQLQDCCTPTHGNWGPWNQWSQCSATCGPGNKERVRTCNNPAPNQCGKPCEGSDRQQTGCHSKDCCVHGVWGDWDPWSECSVTCGTGGVKSRSRRCDSPAPNWCGKTCPGPPSESTSCNCEPCCVHGMWGDWDPWSACSVTCGPGGIRTRSRRCDSPAPNWCGRKCPGTPSETTSCNLEPCCEWSQWSQWSRCPVTCGSVSASRVRTRTCLTIRNRRPCDVPGACPGQSEQRDWCRVPPCLPEASWSHWGEWCPCNCRTGMISRQRKCRRDGEDVPLSECQGAGSNSAFSSREHQPCDVRREPNCPACILDCSDKENGRRYPACYGCDFYIECNYRRATLMRCPETQEYDGDKNRCVQEPSETCSLQEPQTSCPEKSVGSYHFGSTCRRYLQCRNGVRQEFSCGHRQEFNAHSGRCEADLSPTCIRQVLDPDLAEQMRRLLRFTPRLSADRPRQSGRTRHQSPRRVQKDQGVLPGHPMMLSDMQHPTTHLPEKEEKEKKMEKGEKKMEMEEKMEEETMEKGKKMEKEEKMEEEEMKKDQHLRVTEKDGPRNPPEKDGKDGGDVTSTKLGHEDNDVTDTPESRGSGSESLHHATSRVQASGADSLRNDTMRASDREKGDNPKPTAEEPLQEHSAISEPVTTEPSLNPAEEVKSPDSSGADPSTPDTTTRVPPGAEGVLTGKTRSSGLGALAAADVRLRHGGKRHRVPDAAVTGVSPCHANCQGLKRGRRYPSCQGCRFYLVCPHSGAPRIRRCHGRREWDADAGRCKKRSSTCLRKGNEVPLTEAGSPPTRDRASAGMSKPRILSVKVKGT